MSFCKYGETKNVGNGIYYICSVTNYPCKFARWCPTTLKYKPNANFNSCNVKVQQDREYLNKKQEEQTTEALQEMVENMEEIKSEEVENQPLELDVFKATVLEFNNEPVEEPQEILQEEVVKPVKKSTKRKKASRK